MNKLIAIFIVSVLPLFAVSVLAHDKVVVVPLAGKKATGDAVAEDVLDGKTFSNKNITGAEGTMPNNGAMTLNPGASDQAIPQGYHNGSGTVTGDPDLLPSNIKNGTTIFGITGTSIESSGTVTPDQVLNGQTFSNASGPSTGTMPNIGKQNITPSATDQGINPGYHDGTGVVAGDGDLVSDNIRFGVTIFGVDGNTSVVNTSSGDALASDMLNGKKAWVEGSEVTGTMPARTLSDTTTTVQSGYYSGTDLATVDAELIASNIKCGTTLFGVVGTYTGIPNTVCSSTGRVWMDRNLGAAQVATSITDAAAHGDLYQWGRLTDGHEKRTSGTTTTLSTVNEPGHPNFITTTAPPYDWRATKNNMLWYGISGINNPCPEGFRLPTETEFQNEMATWEPTNKDGAFASPLKLTAGGYREYNSGSVAGVGSTGVYWTLDKTISDTTSQALNTSGSTPAYWRAYGFSVRCILD